MSQTWIVHRRERERAALVRLAADADAVAGSPSDVRFDDAAPAQVVVLGLSEDWEAELEFAHRQRGRLGSARWILVGEPGDDDAARALFDQLSIDYMAYPPPGPALRQLLVASRESPRPSLSERALRDTVAGRFSRWLADLELPELLRAVDPRLAETPLLVRGEPGTGRGALIRYVHQFGGTSGGHFVHVACEAATDVAEIRAALDRADQLPAGAPAVLVWLDELGRLTPTHQRQLAAWIELGSAAVRAPILRWVASVDTRGPALEPELAARLGTLEISLPPLRERTEHLESIIAETTAWWARQRRENQRQVSTEALVGLKEYPWPGNLRELEGTLLRSLASTARETLTAEDLSLEGHADPASEWVAPDWVAPIQETEPLDISQVGKLLHEDEEAAADPPSASPTLDPGAGERWPEDSGLRQLASALSLQVRNPLATLRTFGELLPERFDDPEFRDRFAEMVREDVARLHGLMGRVDQLAALDAPQRDKVNLASLLEGLLEQRREAFRRRHLLVLKELDPAQSIALADPEHLRVAFEALIDKAVELLPEQGDLYLASRAHGGEGDQPPTVRILLRFHDPEAREQRQASAADHSLEFLIAELLIRAQGGTLTLGSSEAEERVIVVDLPSI